MCLFRVIKLKFNIKPLFIPTKRQILAQNTLDLVFFRLKMLNSFAADFLAPNAGCLGVKI